MDPGFEPTAADSITRSCIFFGIQPASLVSDGRAGPCQLQLTQWWCQCTCCCTDFISPLEENSFILGWLVLNHFHKLCERSEEVMKSCLTQQRCSSLRISLGFIKAALCLTCTRNPKSKGKVAV